MVLPMQGVGYYEPCGTEKTDGKENEMAVRVYYEEYADLSFIKKEVVAILGYGKQGRSWALNLRDSGIRVVVGNNKDSYYQQAVEDGFQVHSLPEAAKQGTIVCVMIPDEVQRNVYETDIRQHLSQGKMLLFLSGFAVHYGLIVPPKNVDVVDLFPAAYGELVRERFLRDEAACGYVAIGQDATGKAKQRALSLAKVLKLTRGGVIETTFAYETEVNLMLEQILYPGFMRVVILAFETMVEAGYPPEIISHQLYMCKEPGNVFYSFSNTGFFEAMKLWSTTAQYGTMTRGPRLIPDEVKQIMKKHLHEIQSGSFAREWEAEMANGYPVFEKLRQEGLNHPMNKYEKTVREMIRSEAEG